jgi:hypothetical protein
LGIELFRLFTTSYTITTEVPQGGGTITPSTHSVAAHDDATFIITPDQCYEIFQIILDGNTVPHEGVGNSFTLSDVTDDHNITIYFETPDTVPPEFLDCPGDIMVYAGLDAISQYGYANVTWSGPTVQDDCSIDTVYQEQFMINGNPLKGEDTLYYSKNDTFAIGKTNVSFFAFDEAGNSDTCSFFVTVCPNINIKYVGAYLTCTGLTATLKANFIQGFMAPSNFQWYKNGLLLLGETKDSVTISKKGTYSVNMSGSGCDLTSTDSYIEPPKLKINGGSTGVVKCTSENYQMSVNDSILAVPAIAFQWYTNVSNVFSPIQGANANNYSTTNAGTYRCELILSVGCDAKRTPSFTIRNKSSLCLRLNDPDENTMQPDIKLYPNPTTGTFTILLPEPLESPASVIIYDVTGRMISNIVIPKETQQWQMDLSNQPTGAFIVKIVNGDFNSTLRINLTK